MITRSSSNVSFMGLLFLLFLGLKLTGHITWSWWWVTAPLWGSIALVVTTFVGAIGMYAFWKIVQTAFKVRK